MNPSLLILWSYRTARLLLLVLVLVESSEEVIYLNLYIFSALEKSADGVKNASSMVSNRPARARSMGMVSDIALPPLLICMHPCCTLLKLKMNQRTRQGGLQRPRGRRWVQGEGPRPHESPQETPCRHAAIQVAQMPAEGRRQGGVIAGEMGLRWEGRQEDVSGGKDEGPAAEIHAVAEMILSRDHIGVEFTTQGQEMSFFGSKNASLLLQRNQHGFSELMERQEGAGTWRGG